MMNWTMRERISINRNLTREGLGFILALLHETVRRRGHDL